MSAPSEYELQRLENIRRNQEQLDLLFGDTAPAVRAAKAAAKQQKRRAAEALEHRAKWRLIAEDQIPHQTPSNASRQLENESNLRGKRVLAPRRQSARLKEKTETPAAAAVQVQVLESGVESAERNEKLAAKRPSLEQMRQEMAAWIGHAKDEHDADGTEWKQRAVEMWGMKVAAAENEGKVCWKTFCLSRKPVVPKQGIESPLELLQEKYASDCWKLLITCCLMSRVSSAKTKETCISGFFLRWPKPSDVLEATSEQVEEVLAPLGLFYNRYKSVLEITGKFLSMPEFTIDLDENKVYGFGVFAYDSYLMFCRGLAAKMTPDDKNLRAYCAWAKKASLTTGDEGVDSNSQ